MPAGIVADKECGRCGALGVRFNMDMCMDCSKEVDRRIARLLDLGDEWELSKDEIANEVNLSRSAVYQRISRMKRKQNNGKADQ